MFPFRSYSYSHIAAFGGLDPDVVSWAAQVVTNGGTVSEARKIVVSIFVRAEKVSGAWALTDDYWALWGENAIQSLVSLKQRRLAVATNSPTFTADRGYVFDGVTNYINTQFVPSTHGIMLSGTEQRISVYERTNLDMAGYSAGAYTSATARIDITARTGGAFLTGRLNSGAAKFSNSDSRGYHAVSRTAGGTTMKGFKNGVALTDITDLTVGTGEATAAVFIGCINVGFASTFRSCSAGFVSVGAPLSIAQELAAYNAVQAWATAIGANV